MCFISRRWCLYFKFRYPCCIGHKLLLVFMVLMVITVVFLHLYLLPIASGAYNDECYLSEEKRKNLLYVVQTIGKTMEKHNITYWLDYGTLLGGIRYGGIIPWDSDADISFLLDDDNYAFHQDLIRTHGIHSNGLIARYKGVSIDYMRWKEQKGFYNGKEEILLVKHYPKSVLRNENIALKYNRKLESFPRSWVQRRKEIDFSGVKLWVPNETHEFLRHRYPWTYSIGLSVPYKWKCFVPCWIRTANGC